MEEPRWPEQKEGIDPAPVQLHLLMSDYGSAQRTVGRCHRMYQNTQASSCEVVPFYLTDEGLLASTLTLAHWLGSGTRVTCIRGQERASLN